MSFKVEKFAYRLLAGDKDEAHDDDGHSEFGVHIQYEDLYNGIVFIFAIYAGGQIASRIFKMPDLVGEIFTGILLGPPLADFVPFPEAWVLLGEIGLVILVIEAGVDIDLDTLKLIGSRGFIIAFVGSVLPIAIGIAIAFALGEETKAAIATGASFGPTSLGIALNILKSGGVLNTPTGQLIVAAAVIDDMIALVVLSQLQALEGDLTVSSILIPVVSALLFLVVGGYLAIAIVPGIINKYILPRFSERYHGKVELGIMLLLVIGLMPATFYAKASYLMGAFVAGLTFCTSHSLHEIFISQFKRLLQWLMRIFFAASIGFQVPIKEFGSTTIIWQGLVLTIALLGKLATGLLVPNFSHATRYTGFHLRDVLITGCSMAAEGEFAFVIAVFAVDSGLVTKEIYSSIVLAVLISTIIPPFALRYVISKYNKQSEDNLRKVAETETLHKHGELVRQNSRDDDLRACIKNHTAAFFCIQTQSEAAWGLLMNIMNNLRKLGLEVIDHRSWHPRGLKTTLVNEVYVRDTLVLEGEDTVEQRMDDLRTALEGVINQPDIAKVKVTRWFPGVVNEIEEEVQENSATKTTRISATIEERLLNEATEALEKKRALQTNATSGKNLTEILGPNVAFATDADAEAGTTAAVTENVPKKRVRKKTRSTPVFGGSLFGEESGQHKPAPKGNKAAAVGYDDAFDGVTSKVGPSGHSAELVFNNHTYHVRLSDDALEELRSFYRGGSTSNRGTALHGVFLASADTPVVNMLQGLVRRLDQTLHDITEHEHEHEQDEKKDTEEQAKG